MVIVVMGAIVIATVETALLASGTQNKDLNFFYYSSH